MRPATGSQSSAAAIPSSRPMNAPTRALLRWLFAVDLTAAARVTTRAFSTCCASVSWSRVFDCCCWSCWSCCSANPSWLTSSSRSTEERPPCFWIASWSSLMRAFVVVSPLFSPFSEHLQVRDLLVGVGRDLRDHDLGERVRGRGDLARLAALDRDRDERVHRGLRGRAARDRRRSRRCCAARRPSCARPRRPAGARTRSARSCSPSPGSSGCCSPAPSSSATAAGRGRSRPSPGRPASRRARGRSRSRRRRSGRRAAATSARARAARSGRRRPPARHRDRAGPAARGRRASSVIGRRL